MKKIAVLLLIILLSPIIGGIYGIIHDQLTYTISNEYYTKFKFIQFGIADQGDTDTSPRVLVAFVGVAATWWMGLLIGTIFGFVGLLHSSAKQMFFTTINAFGITIAIAFAIGLIGLVYGKFVLAGSGVNWWLPPDLIDTSNFIAVGSMHNFSYAGGIVGMIAGIIYSVKQRAN